MVTQEPQMIDLLLRMNASAKKEEEIVKPYIEYQVLQRISLIIDVIQFPSSQGFIARLFAQDKPPPLFSFGGIFSFLNKVPIHGFLPSNLIPKQSAQTQNAGQNRTQMRFSSSRLSSTRSNLSIAILSDIPKFASLVHTYFLTNQSEDEYLIFSNMIFPSLFRYFGFSDYFPLAFEFLRTLISLSQEDNTKPLSKIANYCISTIFKSSPLFFDSFWRIISNTYQSILEDLEHHKYEEHEKFFTLLRSFFINPIENSVKFLTKDQVSLLFALPNEIIIKQVFIPLLLHSLPFYQTKFTDFRKLQDFLNSLLNNKEPKLFSKYCKELHSKLLGRAEEKVPFFPHSSPLPEICYDNWISSLGEQHLLQKIAFQSPDNYSKDMFIPSIPEDNFTFLVFDTYFRSSNQIGGIPHLSLFPELLGKPWDFSSENCGSSGNLDVSMNDQNIDLNAFSPEQLKTYLYKIDTLYRDEIIEPWILANQEDISGKTQVVSKKLFEKVKASIKTLESFTITVPYEAQLVENISLPLRAHLSHLFYSLLFRTVDQAPLFNQILQKAKELKIPQIEFFSIPGIPLYYLSEPMPQLMVIFEKELLKKGSTFQFDKEMPKKINFLLNKVNPEVFCVLRDRTQLKHCTDDFSELVIDSSKDKSSNQVLSIRLYFDYFLSIIKFVDKISQILIAKKLKPTVQNVALHFLYVLCLLFQTNYKSELIFQLENDQNRPKITYSVLPLYWIYQIFFQKLQTETKDNEVQQTMLTIRFAFEEILLNYNDPKYFNQELINLEQRRKDGKD